MISAPIFCSQFVGRQRELAYLIERRRQLGRSHGGIVLVGGDAGIGKSRLVREFLDATGQSRGRVAIGRCRPFARAPYAPLTELLATFVPDAQRLTPAQTQDEQLRSIADTFLDAAVKHAVVGIIEDLHWSDGATLAVLALLAERLATSRMLFVVTFRANELGPEHPHYVAFGALMRHRSVATISLTRLDDRDVGIFIDATLREAPADVPGDLRRKIAQIAEGNPFFTEELLKAAVDGEQQHQPERSLPTTIHAAILERVAPLPAGDHEILTQAAVIGRRFEIDLLAQTLEIEVAAVLQALQRARVAQIVEETDEAPVFRFRHALTREAIYDRLLAAQRRPLHRRIALALEALPEKNAPLDALAYHWWAADDRAKALAYGERGGDSAQALHAYADSIACYERTLGLLDAHGRDAARLHFKLGLSYGRAGLMSRALEHLREAWAFYRTTTDDVQVLSHLARAVAAATYNEGRLRESTEFLGEAIPVIERCGDPRASTGARLHYVAQLAGTDLATYDAVEMIRRVLDSIDVETIADGTDLLMLYWYTWGRVRGLQGDVDGLRAAIERLGEIADRPIDAGAYINCFAFAAIGALFIGEMRLARDCLQRAIVRSAAVKSWYHSDLLATSAFERTLSGALTEARELVGRALAANSAVKLSRQKTVIAALATGLALGDRELLAHQPDGAFIDEAFETGLPYVYGPLAALCAALLAARGERLVARRLLARAVTAATAALPVAGSFPLAVVAAQQCDREGASAVRELCARSAGGGPAAHAAAELAQAILQTRFGDAAAAIGPARTAADGFAAIGWPAYEALACETAGDGVAATRIRERIGYREASASQPRDADDPLEQLLTPREREIARLVAGGGSNRAIAATLNVTVKLVEKHVSSIYAKLDVSSRTQLTAFVLARDGDEHRPQGQAG